MKPWAISMAVMLWPGGNARTQSHRGMSRTRYPGGRHPYLLGVNEHTSRPRQHAHPHNNGQPMNCVSVVWATVWHTCNLAPFSHQQHEEGSTLVGADETVLQSPGGRDAMRMTGCGFVPSQAGFRDSAMRWAHNQVSTTVPHTPRRRRVSRHAPKAVLTRIFSGQTPPQVKRHRTHAPPTFEQPLVQGRENGAG